MANTWPIHVLTCVDNACADMSVDLSSTPQVDALKGLFEERPLWLRGPAEVPFRTKQSTVS
jgi:hypothetical protein